MGLKIVGVVRGVRRFYFIGRGSGNVFRDITGRLSVVIFRVIFLVFIFRYN